MKCYYYLSPTLESTEAISGDLRQAGIDDWFIHIISKDEAGLSKRRLHSSNYLETLDLIRNGLMGGIIGFILGVIAAIIISVYEPFGPVTSVLVHVGVVMLLTGFGAWQGGLIGIHQKSKKLEPFHDEIHAGKYLILVYASRSEETRLTDVMGRLHPQAKLVGYDSMFYNPFSTPTLHYSK